MLKIRCIVVGPLWTNSYLVWDTEKMEGILIDPGDEGSKLISEVRKHKINLKNIIITHGHFDHLKDAGYVSSKLGIPVMIGEKEISVIEHVSEQSVLFGFSPISPPAISNFLNENDIIKVGDYSFTVLNTPGHSPGSISLYNSSEGVAIVGDLIFYESIGRTDIPGADYSTLIESIKKYILTMPDNTRLLPGHGEETTVGHEKLNNPFLTDEFRYEA